MGLKDKFTAWRKSEAVRLGLFVTGCFLMIIAPLVGLLPGPGGTIVFAIGLGISLQNSRWAKRRYVAIKRRIPKAGSFADWGLRRASAKRREERAKRKASGD